jgi:molybdopterin/thiamine biosynthesis adenylyltransferase
MLTKYDRRRYDRQIMISEIGESGQEKFPVIGVAPAVIGAIQATEVIKYITGTGRLLAGRLLRYDGLNLEFSEFKINKNPDCRQCGRSTL